MPLSPDDRALVAALRTSIAAEAPALAAVHVERAPALGRDAAAIAADAAMLGAGNALAYIRQLEVARAPRRAGDRMGKRAFAVRFPFGDRVARPGVRAWILAEDKLVEAAPPRAGGDGNAAATVVHVDAHAASVALNAAVHALCATTGKVLLVPGDGTPLEPLARALVGAGARLTVEAGGASRAAELVRSADSVTVIAPGSVRASVVGGRAAAGYATDAPAIYVIFPAYYDRAELRQIVRSVAADLRASPSGSTDVEVAICRTWEQRALFRELLVKELAGKGSAPVDLAERRIPGVSGEPRPERAPGLSIAILDADEPADFPRLASAYLATDASAAHAVSAFVHPLELEKAARVRVVDDVLASASASSVAINARPTLAYLIGAVPFGPQGQAVQNAARVDGHDRVVIEAPFHMAPCEARGWALARDRFDHAPSFPRAVGLAVRAIF